MVISEFIAELGKLFPKHREEINGWLGGYARILGRLGPTDLRAAFERTVDMWVKAYPPRPADFAASIPQATKPREPEGVQAIRNREITEAAQAEQRRMIDRTLQAYAETIEAYAKAYEPRASVQMGRMGTATGADALRGCVIHRVSFKAWPLALETARGGKSFAHVELGPDDWREIEAHADTRVQVMIGRRVMPGLGEALARPASPERERQRETMKALAEARDAPDPIYSS